jgi:hypothetical protein
MEQGNETPEMLFEIGKRFYLPSSGVADPLLALYYFNKAAEAGYAPAQRVLGTCYMEGRLTAPDYEKARKWLTEAARRNDGQAAYCLALIYVKGIGVDKDWELAFQLLDMESARHLADARLLKAQLKEELMRCSPQIAEKIKELENKRRSGYTGRRNRFIQPWITPNRPDFEKEEFEIWLKLSLKALEPEAALSRLSALMDSYYDELESAYPA